MKESYKRQTAALWPSSAICGGLLFSQAGHPPTHAENGNIFLEMSSHYCQVSRYNTRSSFLLVSADKIGGREIIALIGNKTLIRGGPD